MSMLTRTFETENDSHLYQVNITGLQTITYVHEDRKTFDVIVLKVIRHNKILEPWILGLYYKSDNQKIWIDLFHDVYKDLFSPEISIDNQIIVYIAPITYPLSLSKEVWSLTMVKMLFFEIYDNMFIGETRIVFITTVLPEILAIEECLWNHGVLSSDRKHTHNVTKEIRQQGEIKARSMMQMTPWSLMKRFFEILDYMNYRKITATFKSSCKLNRKFSVVMIELCNECMEFISTNRRLEVKWSDVIRITSESKSAVVVYKTGYSQTQMKILFDTKLESSQFHILTEKHFFNYFNSTEADKDLEFSIIKSLGEKENELIEKNLNLNTENERKDNQLKQNDSEILNLKIELKNLQTMHDQLKDVYEEKLEHLKKLNVSLTGELKDEKLKNNKKENSFLSNSNATKSTSDYVLSQEIKAVEGEGEQQIAKEIELAQTKLEIKARRSVCRVYSQTPNIPRKRFYLFGILQGDNKPRRKSRGSSITNSINDGGSIDENINTNNDKSNIDPNDSKFVNRFYSLQRPDKSKIENLDAATPNDNPTSAINNNNEYDTNKILEYL